MTIDQNPSHYPPEEFIRNTHMSLQFLKGFGFGYVGASSEGEFSSERYANNTLSVQVRYDQHRGEIDVDLIRTADDGTFPAYLDRTDLWISLDMLVAYSAQGLEPSPKPPLDMQVRFYADQLIRFAGDILSGDLSVFPEVRKFIDEKAVVAGHLPEEEGVRDLIEGVAVEPEQPQA